MNITREHYNLSMYQSVNRDILCNIIVTTMNIWYCILTCHDTMTNKIGIVECWRWVELLLKSRNQFLCLELDLNFTEITTPGSVLGHCRLSLPYSSVMKISLDKSSPELVIDRSNQWWGHFVPTLSPQLGIFFDAKSWSWSTKNKLKHTKCPIWNRTR